MYLSIPVYVYLPVFLCVCLSVSFVYHLFKLSMTQQLFSQNIYAAHEKVTNYTTLLYDILLLHFMNHKLPPQNENEFPDIDPDSQMWEKINMRKYKYEK